MKVQVQFTCPVGVIVDTETGEIARVIVWDDSLDDSKPVAAFRDDYVYVGHPEYAGAVAGMSDDLQKIYSEHPTMGVSLFNEMSLDDPQVKKAIEIAAGDAEWPGWDFGA